MENERNKNFHIKLKCLNIKSKVTSIFRFPFLKFSVFLLFSVFHFPFSIGCSSPPTDLRNFAPSDALVYLETNDLGKTLDALTGSKAFLEAAKAKPDFSRLKNVRLAIVVEGFETSENQVTDENSVLNFKPHFAAIAETYAWNWQTRKIAENNLNSFVKETYGEDTKLEQSEKNGGESLVWTAKDNRKMFAFVENSRIYFGNDQTVIEKCLSASRGQIENLTNSKREFSKAENVLADGFVSTEGIKQIANIAGVSTAMDATEDENGRSFIARFLPALLQNSVKEISWTAAQTEQGIEDKISVTTAPEVGQIFGETLASGTKKNAGDAEFLPPDVYSATVYDLKNPLIAWRSSLLVAAKQTDAASGNILKQFSGSLLAPYEIADAETFLSAIDAPVLTAQLDPDGEKSVVIATVKDKELLKKSIGEINFKSAPVQKFNAEIWKSSDGETAAALIENKLILGNAETVEKCLQAKDSGNNFAKNEIAQNMFKTNATAATFGKDSSEKIVEVLGELKAENLKMQTNYLTETTFNQNIIERRTLSPFGLIGSIIEQIGE